MTMLSQRLRRAPDEVLGRLLRRLEDDPTTVWNESKLESLSGAESDALDALARVTPISVGDLAHSKDARAQAVVLLAAELMDRVVTSSRGQIARSRLASRQELPLSQYTIAFSDRWNRHGDRALTRGIITRIIQEAEAIQWLPFRDVARKPGAMLLAMKRVTLGDAEVMVLVHADQEDAQLRVVNAFRIGSFLVERLRERTPLGLLRSFMREYGVPFRGRFAGSGGLVIDEFIPLDGGGSRRGRLLEWHHPRERNAEVTAVSMFHPLKTGGHHMAYSYSVNLTRYRADRRVFPEGPQ